MSLSPALVALLAGGAGLSAAALYYNQPILHTIAIELGASADDIGLVPMLTQLGYAAGLFTFAPLGDRFDRRRVIGIKLSALAASLVAVGLAPSLPVICAASFAVGLSATAAQDLVPAAAALAPAEGRGKAVGSVMTGLLLGILLSRIASGAVAERFGWRTVFFGAAASIAVLAVLSMRRLPRFAPTTHERYLTLLASILALLRDLGPLRRAALAQGLLSVAFSAFWSTLALVLAAPPYALGSTAAGAFGLAGAAGAIVAPIAGGVADRRGPETVLRAGAALVAASFVAMGLFQGSLAVLILGTIAFDLGVSACLISHQTIVYGLDPAARSRLNAALVTSMFVGMAVGAALASRALTRWGFTGVAAIAGAAAIGALVVRLTAPRA